MNSTLAQRFPILRAAGLQVFPALLLVFLLNTGCTSRKAYICARANARFAPSLTNTIAVVTQAHPKPEDEKFHRLLVEELERRGVHPVPQASADYTLTFWFEETWKPAKSVMYEVNGAGPYRRGEIPPNAMIATDHGGPADIRPRVVDDPFPVQGIRLKLYPTAKISTNRLQAAWDGYIDTGPRYTSGRDARMLRTLLDYFGKEFTGTVKLAE